MSISTEKPIRKKGVTNVAQNPSKNSIKKIERKNACKTGNGQTYLTSAVFTVMTLVSPYRPGIGCMTLVSGKMPLGVLSFKSQTKSSHFEWLTVGLAIFSVSKCGQILFHQTSPYIVQ